MFARMTQAQATPDTFDQAVQQTFAPAAREQTGYAGFLLLASRDTQQLVGISLWEGEEALQASGGSGGYYEQRMRDFVGLLSGSPSTTTYDVVVQES